MRGAGGFMSEPYNQYGERIKLNCNKANEMVLLILEKMVVEDNQGDGYGCNDRD